MKKKQTKSGRSVKTGWGQVTVDISKALVKHLLYAAHRYEDMAKQPGTPVSVREQYARESLEARELCVWASDVKKGP